jgi:DNA polymerase III epsilon subunit-like protein
VIVDNLPYNAVMVDLETMSTESDASIISIGAVRFWLNVKQTEFTPDQLFYTAVSLKSSQEAGLHIKADTVMWWLGQDPEARNAFKNPVSLASALGNFYEFVPNPTTYIFGNGAAYDNVVLHNAYKAINHKYPVSYKYDVCYRTMCKLDNAPPPAFEGTKHNALDDAKAQTRHLMELLEKHPWVKF